jgi:Tfp pilus assembly protein PilW
MQTQISPSKRQAGLSLVETMVATVIGSILMATIMALSSYTARSFAAISNYVDLDHQSRKALDRFTMMIRESDGVTAFSTNSITLSYHAGPLIYSYNPTAQQVTETVNGASSTLLKGATSFSFGIYQRNPVAGSYDQYPAALDSTEAKIVQVSWVCSRKLLGSLINTESIQSAKIVIRK